MNITFFLETLLPIWHNYNPSSYRTLQTSRVWAYPWCSCSSKILSTWTEGLPQPWHSIQRRYNQTPTCGALSTLLSKIHHYHNNYNHNNLYNNHYHHNYNYNNIYYHNHNYNLHNNYYYNNHYNHNNNLYNNHHNYNHNHLVQAYQIS